MPITIAIIMDRQLYEKSSPFASFVVGRDKIRIDMWSTLDPRGYPRHTVQVEGSLTVNIMINIAGVAFFRTPERQNAFGKHAVESFCAMDQSLLELVGEHYYIIFSTMFIHVQDILSCI